MSSSGPVSVSVDAGVYFDGSSTESGSTPRMSGLSYAATGVSVLSAAAGPAPSAPRLTITAEAAAVRAMRVRMVMVISLGACRALGASAQEAFWR